MIPHSVHTYTSCRFFLRRVIHGGRFIFRFSRTTLYSLLIFARAAELFQDSTSVAPNKMKSPHLQPCLQIMRKLQISRILPSLQFARIRLTFVSYITWVYITNDQTDPHPIGETIVHYDIRKIARGAYECQN